VTIAACYVTSEGVVLGADSTASSTLAGGFHYFNFNQKLFEIGEPPGTLGVVTWGLGSLNQLSYRTLLARLADDLQATKAGSVADVVNRWIELFWTEYEPYVKPCVDLSAKLPHDPNINPPDPAARTKAEEVELTQLKRALFVGFCIGGYILPGRLPEAFAVYFDPLQGKPTAQPVPLGTWGFWGAPNVIQRLIFGCDDQIRGALLNSGKWSGTQGELDTLLAQHHLSTPVLPIREAIDFIHACIASTIKALKFSSLAQVCGGPIEIAVITTDRRFRWVRHKEWDAAITDGQ
jgi:hypothetical protein